MKKLKDKLTAFAPVTLEQRQVIRLQVYGCLEYSIAKYMEEKGHVRLFEQEQDLDASDYPYPLGEAGAIKLTFCELTDTGIAARELAVKNDRYAVNNFSSLLGGPSVTSYRDRIVFTSQAASKMIEDGRRDILIVLNRGLIMHSDYSESQRLTELDYFEREKDK